MLIIHIIKELLFLILCDLYSYTYIKLSHNRFIISSNFLFNEIRRNVYLEFDENLLN